MKKNLRTLAALVVAFAAVTAVFYFAAAEPAVYSYVDPPIDLRGAPLDRGANQISYLVRDLWWIFLVFIWGTGLGLFALAERRKK